MFIRPTYVDAVLALPWEEASRDRGASWGSMAAILLHIVEVEDYWFHHMIPGIGYQFKDWDFDGYTSADQVRAEMTRIEAKTRQFLSSLRDDSGERLITVSRDDGVTSTFSVEEILVHVATEEIHHRGELIALLWQLNIDPPIMTLTRWLRYVTGQPL
jgi:uncharacterized damage-inducible protein DinB